MEATKIEPPPEPAPRADSPQGQRAKASRVKASPHNTGFINQQNRAEDTARQLIYAWTEYGVSSQNFIEPDRMPTRPLAEIAEAVAWASSQGIRGMADIMSECFLDASEHIRAGFIECCEGIMPPTPEHCRPLVEKLVEFNRDKRLREIADKIRQAIDTGEEIDSHLAAIEEVRSSGSRTPRSLIVNGVNSYPTKVPPESVILGKNWLRRGDFATFISGAGGGKSVAGTQAAIAWGLGLPYFGIKPPRQLRVLLFSGEDDGVTIGQCREGFLEHSKSITGRQLTTADLDQLDSLIRTEFIREHVGDKFHVHLDALLRESPADLVIVNPLLSYIGGEIVAKASEWLRAGLMAALQQHACAALVIHHTPKLSRDSWDTIDDTYSGIGGGEIANAPRAVLTLKPTPIDDMCVLTVSKRKTTGWKDSDGKFVSSYFVRRTDNPIASS